MIDEIQVRNLALISEASLAPARGLTVLTGETGAGKTALIGALKLLMGGRASADMVRDGQRELEVSGRFYDVTLQNLSDEAEAEGVPNAALAVVDGEAVVVRKVSTDGRSRATLNGTMASMGELTETIAPSVDLCGQFEHQQLAKAATHLALFDAWAGEEVAPAASAYATAFAQATQAAERLDQVRNASELSAAKLDEARFVLRRIQEVDPQPGEYEQLQHDLQIAENAEALATAISTARAALGDDGGALDGLNAAAAALESVAQVDEQLAANAQSLREAGFILEDVAAAVRDYADQVDFDADTLAFQQERFSTLQGLMRTYGPRMEDVFAKAEDAAQTIALVDDYDQNLQRAQRQVDEAEAALAQAADALDQARSKLAPQFAREVTAIMRRLQMGEAQLLCQLERAPRNAWTALRPSAFEFLYKPVADGHPRPLSKIASGGEMSRVLLAVKAVLGAKDTVQTLVFDEVDAGVGGETATALAQLLAELAQTHQVIVVTHLAQVAVYGQAHYVVRREGDVTDIVEVTGVQREQEIARMLSGALTEASLAHARELLQSVH